ncbi:MAG: thioredoxin family protein [Sulfuricurvum sp.]|nr:thioredoxin family protein [Sulfuricurvum sp.]
MLKSTSLKIHSIFGSPLRILALFLFPLALLGAPLSLKNTPYFHPNASVNIVIFYTSWCPPCKRSLVVLDTIKKEHPRIFISRVSVEDIESQKRALPYGLSQSVPLILIADHEGNVIKRFKSLPNKTIFGDLIQRLEEGRLENGTLPIEQRVDTWKMDRKGM